jgi:ankyrin repeat protein
MKDGYTALLLAASEGHAEVCFVLLERGANIGAENKVEVVYY